MGEVVLLIDGEDRLSSIGSGGYIGLNPQALVDQPGLIDPSQYPREVILYRCDCGQAGCGAVVARCYRVDDSVVWDYFDAGNAPPRNLRAPLMHSDAITFAASDYGRAVARIKELAALQPFDAW